MKVIKVTVEVSGFDFRNVQKSFCQPLGLYRLGGGGFNPASFPKTDGSSFDRVRLYKLHSSFSAMVDKCVGLYLHFFLTPYGLVLN